MDIFNSSWAAVCGFTFAADEFREWRVTVPIVLLLVRLTMKIRYYKHLNAGIG